MQDAIARLQAAGFTVKTLSQLPADAQRTWEADGARSPKALTDNAEAGATAMISALATLRANGFGPLADYVQSVPIVFTDERDMFGAPNGNSVMATLGSARGTVAFSLNVNGAITYENHHGNPWSLAEGRAMVASQGEAAAKAFTRKGAALHEMGHALDFALRERASASVVSIVAKEAPFGSLRFVRETISDYAANSGSQWEAEAELASKVFMGRALPDAFKAWGDVIAEAARTGDFRAGARKLARLYPAD